MTLSYSLHCLPAALALTGYCHTSVLPDVDGASLHFHVANVVRGALVQQGQIAIGIYRRLPVAQEAVHDERGLGLLPNHVLLPSYLLLEDHDLALELLADRGLCGGGLVVVPDLLLCTTTL